LSFKSLNTKCEAIFDINISIFFNDLKRALVEQSLLCTILSQGFGTLRGIQILNVATLTLGLKQILKHDKDNSLGTYPRIQAHSHTTTMVRSKEMNPNIPK
jgi:hypothetical protein